MDPVSIALALAQFAPSIMRYFGVGEKPAAVADKVIQIAQQVTGYKTPDEALAAMKQDAQLAQQFNLEVLKADTDLQKAFLTDRQDARARDVEFLKAGLKNQRGDVLAYSAVSLFAGCLVLLFNPFHVFSIQAEARDLLLVFVGILGGIVKDVYGFEFGSSKSGERNAQAVVDIAKQP